MLAKEITELSYQQRIALMEEIWDSLEDKGKNMASPEWHRDIIEKRVKVMETGNAKYISIDELKNS